MDVTRFEFPGLALLRPRVFTDDRGFFLESYSAPKFAEAGIDARFVQDNHAKSGPAGVLRGLHFQAPPAAQAKLVWVTRGAVLDVVLDIRKGSPTYGLWKSFELSADNFLRVFIPRGFAHGYMTLTEDTEFMYKVDHPYDPSGEGGIRFNDPDLALPWPATEAVLSEKDAALPLWRDFESPFTFGQ